MTELPAQPTTYGEAMWRLMEIAEMIEALRKEMEGLEKRVAATRLRVAPLDPLRPIYFNEALG